MTTPIDPCYCGRTPFVGRPYNAFHQVWCDNCYDGAPDAGPYAVLGSGTTAELAAADWNEQQEELAHTFADVPAGGEQAQKAGES